MVDIDVITTLIVGFVKVACTLLSMVGKQHLCPEYIGTRANQDHQEAAASSLRPTRFRWNGTKHDWNFTKDWNSSSFFEEKFNKFPSFQFNFSNIFNDEDLTLESIDFDTFFSCKPSKGSGEEDGGSGEGGEVEEFARLGEVAALTQAIDEGKLKRVLEKAAELLDNPIKWNKDISIDYQLPAKFKSSGTIKDLALENASKYKVNDVTVSDMDLAVKLGLDSLIMNGRYDMDLEIFDPETKLEGEGPFDISFENVDVSMKMSLDENPEREVSLKDFKLEMKPAALKVNLKGLSGGGKSETELNEMMGKEISAKLEMLHSDPEVVEAVKKVGQRYWQLLFDGATIHQISAVMDAISAT